MASDEGSADLVSNLHAGVTVALYPRLLSASLVGSFIILRSSCDHAGSSRYSHILSDNRWSYRSCYYPSDPAWYSQLSNDFDRWNVGSSRTLLGDVLDFNAHACYVSSTSLSSENTPLLVNNYYGRLNFLSGLLSLKLKQLASQREKKRTHSQRAGGFKSPASRRYFVKERIKERRSYRKQGNLSREEIKLQSSADHSHPKGTDGDFCGESDHLITGEERNLLLEDAINETFEDSESFEVTRLHPAESLVQAQSSNPSVSTLGFAHSAPFRFFSLRILKAGSKLLTPARGILRSLSPLISEAFGDSPTRSSHTVLACTLALSFIGVAQANRSSSSSAAVTVNHGSSVHYASPSPSTHSAGSSSSPPLSLSSVSPITTVSSFSKDGLGTGGSRSSSSSSSSSATSQPVNSPSSSGSSVTHSSSVSPPPPGTSSLLALMGRFGVSVRELGETLKALSKLHKGTRSERRRQNYTLDFTPFRLHMRDGKIIEENINNLPQSNDLASLVDVDLPASFFPLLSLYFNLPITLHRQDVASSLYYFSRNLLSEERKANLRLSPPHPLPTLIANAPQSLHLFALPESDSAFDRYTHSWAHPSVSSWNPPRQQGEEFPSSDFACPASDLPLSQPPESQTRSPESATTTSTRPFEEDSEEEKTVQPKRKRTALSLEDRERALKEKEDRFNHNRKMMLDCKARRDQLSVEVDLFRDKTRDLRGKLSDSKRDVARLETAIRGSRPASEFLSLEARYRALEARNLELELMVANGKAGPVDTASLVEPEGEPLSSSISRITSPVALPARGDSGLPFIGSQHALQSNLSGSTTDSRASDPSEESKSRSQNVKTVEEGYAFLNPEEDKSQAALVSHQGYENARNGIRSALGIPSKLSLDKTFFLDTGDASVSSVPSSTLYKLNPECSADAGGLTPKGDLFGSSHQSETSEFGRHALSLRQIPAKERSVRGADIFRHVLKFCTKFRMDVYATAKTFKRSWLEEEAFLWASRLGAQATLVMDALSYSSQRKEIDEINVRYRARNQGVVDDWEKPRLVVLVVKTEGYGKQHSKRFVGWAEDENCLVVWNGSGNLSTTGMTTDQRGSTSCPSNASHETFTLQHLPIVSELAQIELAAIDDFDRYHLESGSFVPITVDYEPAKMSKDPELARLKHQVEHLREKLIAEHRQANATAHKQLLAPFESPNPQIDSSLLFSFAASMPPSAATSLPVISPYSLPKVPATVQCETPAKGLEKDPSNLEVRKVSGFLGCIFCLEWKGTQVSQKTVEGKSVLKHPFQNEILREKNEQLLAHSLHFDDGELSGLISGWYGSLTEDLVGFDSIRQSLKACFAALNNFHPQVGAWKRILNGGDLGLSSWLNVSLGLNIYISGARVGTKETRIRAGLYNELRRHLFDADKPLPSDAEQDFSASANRTLSGNSPHEGDFDTSLSGSLTSLEEGEGDDDLYDLD